MNSLSKTQDAPVATDFPTTTGELVIALENNDKAEFQSRIQNLSLANYIHIKRTICAIDAALSDYAIAWKDSEYWGHGTPFPDEAKAA